MPSWLERCDSKNIARAMHSWSRLEYPLVVVWVVDELANSDRTPVLEEQAAKNGAISAKAHGKSRCRSGLGNTIQIPSPGAARRPDPAHKPAFSGKNVAAPG